MKCRACGEELPEGARFCPACGAPAEEIPASKKLEEPLDAGLAGGAVPLVPLVPLAPPPRATRVDSRGVRGRAVRPAHPGASTSLERRARDSYGAGASHVRQPVPDQGADDAGFDDDEKTASLSADGAAVREAGDTTSAAEKPRAEAGVAVRAAGVREGLSETLRSAFGGIKMPGRGGARWALIAALVAAVAVVGAFFVLVSTSWLGPLAPPSTPAPEVQPPSDGSIAPLEGEEDSDEEQGQTTAGDLEPRDEVEDYSWAELAEISQLIADADTDADALELAETYNLCGRDGELDGTQTKDLELSDGTTVPMMIAGFRQDERSDGSGVAGITFIAAAPVAEGMALCPNEDKGVGWRDSTLRAWLADDLMDELPDELADAIVAVDKRTNPVIGSGTSQITTSDKLWLPSFSEVTGSTRSDGSYEEEGDQYQLFVDEEVGTAQADILAVSDSYWWLRSPDTSNELWFMCVAPDGSPVNFQRPATENDVVIGFCL